jgi:antibiotic biosynthesis monooxygenase (ABM) superfamily enzyme
MKKFNLICAILLIYFSAFSQAPTITSFSPVSGPVGTLVTITGANLSNSTAFSIGGVAAIIVSNVDTALVGLVMPDAVTDTLSVTTSNGTTYGSSSFFVTPTFYPCIQQGSKLVGTGAINNSTGGAGQGKSVSLSADGNTAIVGGPADNVHTGAAWIYTRSDTNWVQQGNKLVGIGTVGNAYQGCSVALSADGNTAIVGGYFDNNDSGAAWVYTRSGTTWRQQGSKLVGTGAVGAATQGSSVALSADGNTAIVGGPTDNSVTGAVWIFTRSDTTWTQQGSKLVGTGAIGRSFQGGSVALSSDGNTAIVGGNYDNTYTGAAWIYTRIGTIWTQQGSKLIGTGAVGAAYQGQSVSISADGNTAIVGGWADNSDTGAAWVYTRVGGVWTQQGSKLVGTGSVGNAHQGTSVAISADGNSAIVGGIGDIGAVWVYTRLGNIWAQQGSKLVGTGAVGNADQGWSACLSANGNTVIVGGFLDNNDIGAAWVFGPSCSPSSSNTYDTILRGALPYAWNGLTFTTPGTQTAHLTSSAGCDSLATLVIAVLPTGINEINSTNPIHLYPNPNKGSFTLQTSNSIGATYSITDMLGNTITQQTIHSDNQPIDLPEAAEGVYTLVVKGTQPLRFVIVR